MELEAFVCEVAIDRAVGAGDVGAVFGQSMRRQVIGILGERHVELERTRRSRRLRPRDLREHVLQDERAAGGYVLADAPRLGDHAEVPRLVRLGDVPGVDRARERGARAGCLVLPHRIGGTRLWCENEDEQSCGQRPEEHDPSPMLATIR